MAIRDNLSKTTHLAAISRHSGTNLAIEEIQELPLATQQTKKYMIPLVCSRTGITVGSFSTITVAGHAPLLGQWKDTQVLHPLFSLNQVALLQFARNTWLRFCALSPEETQDATVVSEQEKLLRVSALAMLHNLSDVQQDVPWLPSWVDVSNNWQSLIALSYWKAYLDSTRFRFPTFRLSKLVPSLELNSYLKICWAKKKEYETVVNANIADAKEKLKAEMAEKAMVAIRDEIAGKKPLSIKILWRWLEQQMPRRYDRDMQGWMWDLFSATEKDISDFTVRDVELWEEIFLSEVPLGSTISHAVLEVIRGKHKLLTNHYQTYEIIIPESITAGVASGEIQASAPEPKLADYPSKTKWLIAVAKWKLAQPDATKHQRAAAEQHRRISVSPSFVPVLKFGADADDIPELEASEPSNFGDLGGIES